MLQQLRDTAKNVVSSILLGLLVVSFGIWGIGDIFRMGGMKDWVAKIGGHKIPRGVVQQEFRNDLAQMRAMLGPSFTEEKAVEMGLLQRSLDKVLTVTSINMETNRLGYHVGREDIVRTLENAKELRNPDGSFNRELFRRILSQQGLSEAGFIDTQKQIVARNLLISSLAAPVSPPAAFVDELAAALAQKRVAEIVTVKPSALPAPSAPSTEDLKKYYEDNKDRYRSTETRSFKAIVLTPAEAGKGLDVSDDELRKAYEERKAEFDTPEKRDVTQLVLSSEEEAKAIADKAAAGLSAAAKVAGKETVKLEASTRNDLPPALADAVFAAPAARVAGPIQTSLGWHVFTVDRIISARSHGFDEVKAELKAQMQKDKSAEHMVQIANKVDDLLASGKHLDDVAAALGLTVASYENRNASGKNPSAPNAKAEMPFMAETLKAAFQYPEGEISPLIEAKDGGYVCVEIVKVMPAAVQSLETVEASVKEDWVKAEKAKRAEKIASTIMEELKNGKALSAIAGDGVSIRTSSPLAADDTGQKEIPREALAPLFDLKKGEVAAITAPDGELVLRVKDVINGTAKDVETRKDAAKGRLIQEWHAGHLDELNAALRRANPPEIDEAGLKAIAGNNAP